MEDRSKQFRWYGLALAFVIALVVPRDTLAWVGLRLVASHACGETWELSSGIDSHFFDQIYPAGKACASDGLGFCDGVSVLGCVEPERGTLHPKYFIAGVRYMPPGYMSSIYRSKTRKTGTITTIKDSFSKSTEDSIGFSNFLSGNSNVDRTVTATERTDSASVMYTTTSGMSLVCDYLAGCSDAINHGYDVVDVLVNPTVNYAAFPSTTPLPPGVKRVSWGLDLSAAIPFEIPVRMLNGARLWDVDLQGRLAGYGIGCPSSAPCPNESEYAKILSATGYGFREPTPVAVPGSAVNASPWNGNWPPNPGRFQRLKTELGATLQFTVGAGTKDIGTVLSVDNSSSQASSTTHSYSVETTVSPGYPVIGSLLAGERKEVTFTHSTSSTQIDASEVGEFLHLGMPRESGGPVLLVPYIDRLYNTIMLSACATDLPGLMVGCALGPPLPGATTRVNAVASPTHSSVALSWAPVMGATSFSVGRSTTNTPPGVSVGTTEGFTFVDTSATDAYTRYYYWISAINQTGSDSVGSVSAAAVVPRVPGLAVSRTGPKVTLTVDSALPGSFAHEPYTFIDVWRRANGSAQSEWIGTTTSPVFGQGWVYSDTPPPGARYYYAVTGGFDQSGELGTPPVRIAGTGRSSRSIEVLAPSALAAPALSNPVAGNGSVALSWSPVAGAVTYNVKRSTVSGGPYATVATVATASYANTGLTNGAIYYYVVSAANGGDEGPDSAQVSGVPVAPAPPPKPRPPTPRPPPCRPPAVNCQIP